MPHVGRNIPEKRIDARMEAIATREILAGASTTRVFRAMGLRSATSLYRWLADKPDLRDRLKANAAAYRVRAGHIHNPRRGI